MTEHFYEMYLINNHNVILQQLRSLKLQTTLAKQTPDTVVWLLHTPAQTGN